MVLFQASLRALVDQFNRETEVLKWLRFFLEEFDLKNSENHCKICPIYLFMVFEPLVFTGISGDNEKKTCQHLT